MEITNAATAVATKAEEEVTEFGAEFDSFLEQLTNVDENTPAGPRRAITGSEHAAKQATDRRTKAFSSLGSAIEATPDVPAPVTEIIHTGPGTAPKLSAEALEASRVTYYLHFGTLTDAAKSLLASGLVDDTDDMTIVRDRLRGWWTSQGWPKRSAKDTFAIRDANHDGGLYRSTRICGDVATGSGPAPKGKPCGQSAMTDSEFCFHHDPRPEYVEARRIQAERLKAGRQANMVPLEPMQKWCEEKRKELLAEAKAAGPVHHNNKGWCLVADALSIDQSILKRLMDGKHSNRSRPPVTLIKATTVERYISGLDVTFKDIYGFDPPVTSSSEAAVCPGCGGPKNHGSKTCRDCYDDSLGEQCAYVKRSGRRCPTITKHESGYCPHCRRSVFRVSKPRTGRPTALSDVMLLFALDEFRRSESIAWVAKLMWATNAGKSRQAFKSRTTLASGLVKRFKKLGLTGDPEAVDAKFTELVDAHGDPNWPTPDQVLESGGEVPFAPFKAWIVDRLEEVGSYRELAKRTGINPDTLSQLVRGTGRGESKYLIRRRLIDDALEAFEGDTTYDDLLVLEVAS